MIDKDTIIRMAREAGLTTGDNQKHNGVYWWRSLGRPTNVSETDLHTLAQAAYRQGLEDAAKLFEGQPHMEHFGREIVDAIRELMKEPHHG